MHRRAVVLLAIAGCSPPASPPAAGAPAWVYAPAPVALLGAPAGRFGRSQAPQQPRVRGITGEVTGPLRLATPWAVPGERARAVVYGVEGSRSAIELHEIDEGRVAWRDTTACGGPIVGVTQAAIVCADASGTRGVGLDGKPRWASTAGAYLAMTDDRVVIAGAGEAIVLDADSGDELARVKLPPGVASDSVLASCGDAGRELFAAGQDGNLTRIAEAKGGPAISWAVPIGKIDELDACRGAAIVVREAGVDGGALVSIARATGAVTGRVDGVHGAWPARDGSERIEIATASGLATWPRDLAGEPTTTSGLPLGELLASRGDRRLVRSSERTAVLLDRDGVRAYLPFAAMGAVLGDDAIIGASWTGSVDHTVRRLGLPGRYRKQLRLPAGRAGVAVPAELRDLPAVETLAEVPAIANPDAGKHAVLDVAIDPDDSAVIYTLQLERPDDETGTAGVASLDLAKRTWRWQRADACGTGEVVGFAIARDVIACGSRTRTLPAAVVRATSRDGAARWEWEGDGVDRLEAAGDAVVLYDADRALVLDAATGELRGRITSEDGAPVRAAVVRVGEGTFVVAYEHGRVVTRLAASMLPVWSLAVDGVVAAITASDAGVLIELEDGDGYRIALPGGEVFALPGLNLAWRAAGDLVTAHTAGGPIPGELQPPPPVRRVVPARRRRRPPPVVVDPERPKMWTPIAPPASLGDSWQLTLYELEGGLRARNDYGLHPPTAPGRARGPAGSPVVVASSPGLREVLVIDPRDGAPMRRVELAEDAAPGLVFGTVVDGTPVAGAVLQAPLRVVVF